MLGISCYICDAPFTCTVMHRRNAACRVWRKYHVWGMLLVKLPAMTFITGPSSKSTLCIYQPPRSLRRGSMVVSISLEFQPQGFSKVATGATNMWARGLANDIASATGLHTKLVGRVPSRVRQVHGGPPTSPRKSVVSRTLSQIGRSDHMYRAATLLVYAT